MKQIFTNIDLAGNSVSNLVIGTRVSDPSGVEYGFIYRNSTTDRLRVYTENGWEDLVHTPGGNIIKLIDSFNNLQGRGDTIYVKLREGTQDEYDVYVYVNNTFYLINDSTIHWQDIVDAPNILDCSYYNVNNEEELQLFYI